MSESEPVFYEIYCPNGCFEPAPFPYREIRNWNIKCIICGEFCMMNYEKKYKVVLNPNRLDEDELKKGGSILGLNPVKKEERRDDGRFHIQNY